jgi:hypothetical protein
MTQTKTGAFPSMGRIPQLFGHTVLAASMLAGSAAVLNAGGAMAVLCGGTNPHGFDYTNLGASTPGFTNPTPSCDSPVVGDPTQVNVDHDYPAQQPFNASGNVAYKLAHTINPHNFIKANIDADIDGLGTYSFTFNKDVYRTEADFLSSTNPTNFNFTNVSGVITVTPPGGGSLVGYGSEIWVRDSWTISGNAEVDNITNTFQTPGPLPILGAGAAFGFSRKLRGRIKAARLG